MQSKRREDKGFGSLYPRLQYAAFPDAILTLEHVLTSIDELLMTPQQAAVCAARVGQVERLREILGGIGFVRKTADDLFEIAAASGNCDMLDVVHGWSWVIFMYTPDCKIMKAAIRHGHLNAVEHLLFLFNWSLTEPLKQALESKQQEILELLCHKASSYELCWAAAEGHLQVVQLTYSRMHDNSVYQALTAAASGGHLHIIAFLFDVRGWHRYVFDHVDKYDSAIVLAAKQGHEDIVQFLVNNRGFVQKTELEDAFKAAAARGHIGIMELLYDQGVQDRSLLSKA